MKLTTKLQRENKIASKRLKEENPHFTSKDINELLNIDPKDRSQTHPSHYGIWEANKKLNLSGGYKMK